MESNNSLLKFKISTLETEIVNKDLEITNLKKNKINITAVDTITNKLPTFDHSGASAGGSVWSTVTQDHPNWNKLPAAAALMTSDAGSSNAPNQFITKKKSNNNIIRDAFEACCPLKKITNSTDQGKKWITPEIIRAKHDLKNLYWLYVNLKCQYTFDLYKKAKVLYSSLVSNSRFNYHSELIDQSENKNKTVWWLGD
ncbi:hypothetical protein WA026_016815 [Henosepilachna vigintioctopunctata]|uniref:Uncharacterized protein n=1 Tax=Henosepilachna vigintioctopunctata TaxID=420089 RepID=A0AAW1V061_9CUCU